MTLLLFPKDILPFHMCVSSYKPLDVFICARLLKLFQQFRFAEYCHRLMGKERIFPRLSSERERLLIRFWKALMNFSPFLAQTSSFQLPQWFIHSFFRLKYLLSARRLPGSVLDCRVGVTNRNNSWVKFESFKEDNQTRKNVSVRICQSHLQPQWWRTYVAQARVCTCAPDTDAPHSTDSCRLCPSAARHLQSGDCCAGEQNNNTKKHARRKASIQTR